MMLSRLRSSAPTVVAQATSVAPIGTLLKDAGLLTEDAVERVLALQRDEGWLFGEAAVRLDLVSRGELQYALARQFNYPYVTDNGERQQLSRRLYAAYEPFGSMAEQLRAIRSQLLLRWYDRATKQTVLAIVSPERADGRSELAANLAIMFAQLGERTLLIDADMRSPRQHELFGLRNRSGLSDLLAGRAGEVVAVPVKSIRHLDVLTAGPMPPNPLELLSHSSLSELLMSAADDYPVIVLDTPALSSGTDAYMIAVRAGAALAVACNHHTRFDGFGKMVEALLEAGVNVAGSVLNDPPAAIAR